MTALEQEISKIELEIAKVRPQLDAALVERNRKLVGPLSKRLNGLERKLAQLVSILTEGQRLAHNNGQISTLTAG